MLKRNERDLPIIKLRNYLIRFEKGTFNLHFIINASL